MGSPQGAGSQAAALLAASSWPPPAKNERVWNGVNLVLLECSHIEPTSESSHIEPMCEQLFVKGKEKWINLEMQYLGLISSFYLFN